MLKSLSSKPRQNSNRKKTKSILTNEQVEDSSYRFVELVGYVILGLIFFDYLHLLIPPKFLNPNWEMEVVGRIIESIWILLLGFLLVFFRPQQKSVKAREIRVLSFLSWTTLLVAICCFLAAPLLISDALRINSTNQAQINAQLASQNERVEQILAKVETANDSQITALLKENIGSIAPDINNPKQELVNIIQQRKTAATAQLNIRLRSQQKKLLKTTFKWTLGAIISGIAFVAVWRYTAWTRSIKL